MEERNSGYPLELGDDLYYLLLDNVQLKTELVRYHLPTTEKSILATTQGRDAFYNGLSAYGNELFLKKELVRTVRRYWRQIMQK